jgi:hypothetical protein
MQPVNQELLLVITPDLTIKYDDGEKGYQPVHLCGNPKEEMEAASWQGNLEEWLPGTIEKNRNGASLPIQKILVADRFALVLLSEQTCKIDCESTLNPYFITRCINYN